MNNLGWYIRKLWWVGFLLVAIFIVIIIFIVARVRTIGANLDIFVAPGNAKVYIDGQKSGDGRRKVSIGEHEIKVERDGYETSTQQVTASDELLQIAVALTPVSDKAKQEASKNQKAYSRAEELGGIQSQQEGQSVFDQYPLLARLPYDTGFYSINYAKDTSDNDESYYVRIDANGAIGRQVALKQIRDWGYDPTSYRIIFPGIDNPLDPAREGIVGE